MTNSISFSQEMSSEFDYEEELINIIDRIYGSDDLLLNGPNFYPSHYGAAGHPYFATDKWSSGSIYFNEHVYEKIPFKYNLEINEIILQAEKITGAIEEIILNSSFVDSFRIDDHIFINAQIIDETRNLHTGYVELLYSKRMLFLVKHKKSFASVYNDKTPMGKYNTHNPVYYIIYENNITKIANRKAFLTYFEEYKKEIKKYLKKHKLRFKEASNAQLYSLMKYCDEISSN